MKILGIIATILLFSGTALAGVSVIVHPSNSATLDQKEIARIYLGKAKSFSNGEQAVPINLAEGDSVRDGFDNKVLEKSSSQLKAYWSKLVFTGKGTPPKEVTSAEEVIKLVASNPNTIGYVDSSKVDGTVKVVTEF